MKFQHGIFGTVIFNTAILNTTVSFFSSRLNEGQESSGTLDTDLQLTESPDNHDVNGNVAAQNLDPRDMLTSELNDDSKTKLRASEFSVDLDFFHGPMDLLLHLVHQQEVNIEQVSMRDIAEQYLNIISRAQLLDIERASEYLVIAATLLSIKSQSLLPASQLDGMGEQVERVEDENFYEELRARLKAYELTKSRAQALVDLPQLGVDVFARHDKKSLLPTPEMLAEPEEVTGLAMLFGRLLKRIGDSTRRLNVRVEQISVVSYMMKIVDSFQEKGTSEEKPQGPVLFRNLIQKFFKRSPISAADTSDNPEAKKAASKHRSIVIGSFIAVLELMKRGLVAASQPTDADDIHISMKMTSVSAEEEAKFSSEFDTSEAETSQTVPLEENNFDSNSQTEITETRDESKVIDMNKYRQNSSGLHDEEGKALLIPEKNVSIETAEGERKEVNRG